jgi:ribosome-associated protein
MIFLRLFYQQSGNSASRIRVAFYRLRIKIDFMLSVNDQININERFIEIRYVRSRGPGGQNVNKLNTRAQLIFALRECTDLSSAVKSRLKKLAGRRMTTDGRMILQSDRYRHQGRNRQECLDRLRRLIRKVLTPPKPRIPTKPSRAAKEKRLSDKKYRSKVKNLRGRVTREED